MTPRSREWHRTSRRKLRAQTNDSLGVLGGCCASTAIMVLLKHCDPSCTGQLPGTCAKTSWQNSFWMETRGKTTCQPSNHELAGLLCCRSRGSIQTMQPETTSGAHAPPTSWTCVCDTTSRLSCGKRQAFTRRRMGADLTTVQSSLPTEKKRGSPRSCAPSLPACEQAS